jgi:hypothetical protein
MEKMDEASRKFLNEILKEITAPETKAVQGKLEIDVI